VGASQSGTWISAPPAGGQRDRPRRDGYGVVVRAPVPMEAPMFLFFSNRLGCLGSVLVSLAVTAILVVVFLL
jgi:hypothetical protein